MAPRHVHTQFDANNATLCVHVHKVGEGSRQLLLRWDIGVKQGDTTSSPGARLNDLL